MTVADLLSVLPEDPFVIWEDITTSTSYRNDWIPRYAKITKIEALGTAQFKATLDVDFETALPEIY